MSKRRTKTVAGWISLSFSVSTRRERKEMLAALSPRKEKGRRDKEQRGCVLAMREVLVPHCTGLAALVKHIDEIEWPRASVTHDLGAI
jgi:hypothetical protein